MEEMNIDFDIEDDLIKKFLLHKLEEIKFKNSELERQCDRRKELLNECVEKIASEVRVNILELTGTWQRTLNGKWIIGIGVRNTSNEGSAKSINAILNWDSSNPFTYSVKTFCRYKRREQEGKQLPEKLKRIARSLKKSDNRKLDLLDNEWIRSDDVADNSIIVLCFDIPEFVDKSEYNISGLLSYQYKEKFYQLSIPVFKVAISDWTDNSLSIKSFEILGGNEEAYLSNLMANEETELIMRISDNMSTSLENLLEIELAFRKANVLSGRKTFFYVENIGSSGYTYWLALEEVTKDVYNLNVFSRNQASLHLMLQILYRHIPGVIILPKQYKENLLDVSSHHVQPEFLTQRPMHQEPTVLNSVTQELGKCLESQISLVETLCAKGFNDVENDLIDDKEDVDLNVDIKSYQEFRKQLADLELTSDLLYVKMKRVAGKAESVSEVDIEML